MGNKGVKRDRLVAQNHLSSLLLMVGFQALALTTICIALWLWDTEAAMCALLGGVIGVVIQIYFATKLLLTPSVQNHEDLVRSVYLGETIKLSLIVVSFTLSLILVEALKESKNFFWFFIAFMVSMLVSWLAPLRSGANASE
ncbi:MAG TPA: hypothetical protein DCZ03_16125 [Gammaproteobacteria bacterium]|nr:hypothetical protein [Gammaproteobacteria bacterium]